MRTPARVDGPDGSPLPPVIVVHSLAHAIAALQAAAQSRRRVVIASAPEAGHYAGPGWFGALVRGARDAVPGASFAAVIDCGDDAGAALAAIRMAIERVMFIGRAEIAGRLADIARAHGVALETVRPQPDLDLAADFFAADATLRQRCVDMLASFPQIC